MIILKAFSNLPHSKIECLKEKLQHVNNFRQNSNVAPETPLIESDQESGEVHLNDKEERFKTSPKKPTLNKRSNQDKSKKYTNRENNYEDERNDKDSQSKPRPSRSDRTDRGDYKNQSKSFNAGYKRHKYY